jgi:hypothetical protein
MKKMEMTTCDTTATGGNCGNGDDETTFDGGDDDVIDGDGDGDSNCRSRLGKTMTFAPSTKYTMAATTELATTTAWTNNDT